MSGYDSKKQTPTRILVRRLVGTFLRPYFPRLLVAAVFMGLAAAMTATQAKLMRPIIDRIFVAHDESALMLVAAGVFGAFLLRGISTYMHSVTMNDIGQRIVADIQRLTFAHLIEGDLAFFNTHPSAELMTRLTSDVGMMRTAVAEVLTSFIRSTLTLLALIVVMFQEDWQLALISFSVFPLASVFVARLGRRMRRISGNTQAELAGFATVLNQVFQSMRHVKAYGMEPYETARATARIDQLYRLTHKIFRVSAISQPVSELLSGIAIVTLVLYGGHEVIVGHRTAGQLFSFITAFLLAYEPLKRAGKLNGVMQTGLAAADRVFALLDTVPMITDRPDARPISQGAIGIELKNVTFGYGDGRDALSNVSLRVEPGERVALVGPSGAGKSTILNLVPRFYDVQSGAVCVGGIDVREASMQSLRRSMALVSQDVSLFNDTVARNIGYGREGAPRAEIEDAAKAAAAHEFIMQMPHGYETVVGENGVMLSGGQRQRLAIARAILRDAPILLLDEATSALDSQSEQLVQQALATLFKNRTSIVIAHRLSTVIDADRICVMNGGQIVETGTHQELLSQQGLYARLYAMQGLGLIEAEPA